MEFEELQQVWDSQNSRPLYTVDEEALHNRILLKKKQTRKITNISELLLIIIHAGSGGFLLGIDLSMPHPNIYIYISAAWMFCCALYLLKSRIRRIRSDRRFDRSMHGDLDLTISTATYQVRLSRIMRWNVLPVGLLTLLALQEGRKPVWTVVGVIIVFAIAWYGGSLEHGHYKARKRALELFRKNLESGC